LSPATCDFHGVLSPAEIDFLLADDRLKFLRATGTVDLATWRQVNNRLFSVRPRLQLFVHAEKGESCDLDFLAHMGNVRRLNLGPFTQASGVENICCLKDLEHLSIEIKNLDSFEFLRNLQSEEIEFLQLGNTSSKKPSLQVLERFPALRILNLFGHKKHIDVIGSLLELRCLSLQSIALPSLAFLRRLPKLEELHLSLGGTVDLTDLPRLKALKFLWLDRTRKISDLAVISEVVHLQTLALEGLPKVTQLPDLARLSALRDVSLSTMNGLRDLDRLVSAPALEALSHWNARCTSPIDYMPLLESGRLKKATVHFTSDRKNRRFREVCAAARIAA